MKTRTWILLLSAVALVCLGLSLWVLLPGSNAAAVEVWSEGGKLCTLSLAQDRTMEVESKNGTNVITVKDGKVAVTEADCPDGHCMARGYCSGGVQIVCLPNRLVLKFTDDTGIDGVAG